MRTVALALALLMVATPATAELRPNVPTDTTLYFHIFDTFNKFVINTQPINDDFFNVGGTNFPTLSGTPLNNDQVGEYDLNTIYGTSTAGPVEYKVNENGQPRFHPERGIAADVNIHDDPSNPPVAYIYLDVRDIVGSDSGPMILPDFTFDVTMRAGDDPGPDAQLDQGELIMSGSLTATIYEAHSAAGSDAVVSGASPVTEGVGFGPVLTPDENGIVELAIPLTIANPTIPKADAFNIRLDWYQLADTPAFEDDQFATGYMRLALTEEYLPRIEMQITNPVYIEFIHPQPAAGILLIHTGVNSPWGTYDVDVKNITVSIDGPAEPKQLTKVVAQNAVVHGLHDQAAEVTYLWRFRDEGAPEGEYTINFAVQNYHHNAEASGSALFKLEGKQAYAYDEDNVLVDQAPVNEGQDSPAAGLLLGALALLGVALRRRQ
ncbi:MAG: hypothetical protein ACPHK8_02225 [Thermoplasmatota archaeon]